MIHRDTNALIALLTLDTDDFLPFLRGDFHRPGWLDLRA